MIADHMVVDHMGSLGFVSSGNNNNKNNSNYTLYPVQSHGQKSFDIIWRENLFVNSLMTR